ncbi:MAG: squalene synthase HpnC [Planctomycetes bacterium]|nr:squalene synthase HpnC [Planctomycetota bacterium]
MSTATAETLPPNSSVQANAWADQYTRTHSENFSVLSVLLPRGLAADFSAIYSFCRAADDLADETGNDEAARRKSLELLGDFRAKLRRAAEGDADEPLFVALAATMRKHRLPIQPFEDLIRAFEVDQVKTRHQTWDDVVEYSKGSANPVGRLVLMVCGYRPPEEDPRNAERWAMSDAICTALQLTNFWQDVRRDLEERDRVYLPLADSNISVEELRAWMNGPSSGEPAERYCAAIRELVRKTWLLFDQGRPLPSTLNTEIAPVIRLFQAGGEAILRKIERMEYATLWARPRIGKAGKGWLVVKEIVRSVAGVAGVSGSPVRTPVAASSGSDRSASEDRRVTIVGGGVAGIAAAVTLADRGVPVTLLEAKRRLGGRATSFVDQGTGETLDNCQHIALGCCTAYLSLCERLGATDLFDWHSEQYWIEAGGRESIIRPGIFPAPAHYTEAFLTAKFLSLADKLAIGRAMLSIRVADRSQHTHDTFGEYLRALNQTPRAIDRFWAPIVVSACNLSVDRVAASSALKVFQDGFLAGGRAGVIGVPKVPLVRLYDAAAEIIAASGGEVRLGVNVESLDERTVTVGGQELRAGAVICALPVEKAARVVAPECRDARFAAMNGAKFSPILGVHLEFDRAVLGRPHAVLVDRATQWLFRKDESGRRLHAVVSGADEWVELSEAQIVERVAEDVRACLPGAAGAAVTWSRAVKERRATFAATPEFERSRPTAVNADGRGVILAGDYTLTDWPATMEGATRSGVLAAELALKRLVGVKRGK